MNNTLKSGDMEVMAYDNLDQVIEEFFDSLLSRYQLGLETQMRGSDLIFHCVNSLVKYVTK